MNKVHNIEFCGEKDKDGASRRMGRERRDGIRK